MHSKRVTFPGIIILIVLICATWIQFSEKGWEKKPGLIYWDVVSYYAYLPATFIYNDLKLEKGETFEKGRFWPETTKNGEHVIKTTMGLSFLYAPFFGLAHLYAKFTGTECNGFSAPYQIALLISSLFYLLIGLIFLRKILLRFFSEATTALTILTVTAGTNLAYYLSYEPIVSHGYIFSMGCIFLWLVILWHEAQNTSTTILLGITAGLLTLIRPTNIVILIFFLFYGANSATELKQKLSNLLHHPKLILLLTGTFLIPWIPQMAYWQYTTGKLFFYSYTSNEHFIWFSPKFAEILWGYRKGWLLYTPIMALSIIGMFFLRRKLRPFLLATMSLLFPFIYLVSCWWCWWFGGSFGMRPMIDIYAFLCIPIAASIETIQRQTVLSKYSGLLVLLVLLIHNLFQIAQYKHGAIHYAFMTKEAYWNSFGHINTQPGFYESLKEPDPEPAKLNIQALTIRQSPEPLNVDSSAIVWDYRNHAEIASLIAPEEKQTEEKAFDGKYAIETDKDHPLGFQVKIAKEKLQSAVLVRVKELGSSGRLIIQAEHPKEYCVSLAESSPIPNSDWEQQEVLIPTPELRKSTYIRIYCCNPVGHYKQYYDDLEIAIIK